MRFATRRQNSRAGAGFEPGHIRLLMFSITPPGPVQISIDLIQTDKNNENQQNRGIENAKSLQANF